METIEEAEARVGRKREDELVKGMRLLISLLSVHII